MLASPRMAVLVACSLLLPGGVAAQHTPKDTSRVGISADVAAGMMRYGPQVALGATISSPRSWIGARVDLMLGVAPAHEVPGTNFMAATAAGVLPIHPTRRVAPYLMAGAAVSQSRFLPPAIGAVGGAGVRFDLGVLRPYVEGRAQHRVGPSFLVGFRF